MRSLIVPLLLFIFTTVKVIQSQNVNPKCETSRYPPPSSDKIGWITVNLDLPPEERWLEPLKPQVPAIRNLIVKIKEFVTQLSNGSKVLVNLIDNDLGWIADQLPAPFDGEIKGIANVTGLNLGEVVLYNIFYEVFTVCTSIVAEDSSGKLFHGRNLDFGLFLGWDIKNNSWIITEALRPAITNVLWTRGGKTLFKSVNFAGYVGILTAVRPKLFTLSMDERFNIDGGYIGIINWLLGDRKSQWMGFLTRKTMENATSYDNARMQLANEPMLAPAYFILGGNSTGQGCVITRDRDGAIDTWYMKKKDPNWYILETNYDHWKAPFFLDDRRSPANNCMKKTTSRGMSFAGMFNVLSSQPVRNKLTTYTALMQVNTGQLESYKQYCNEPSCVPW